MKLTTNATAIIFDEMNRNPRNKALIKAQYRAACVMRADRQVALIKAWDRRFRVEAARLGFTV